MQGGELDALEEPVVVPASLVQLQPGLAKLLQSLPPTLVKDSPVMPELIKICATLGEEVPEEMLRCFAKEMQFQAAMGADG